MAGIPTGPPWEWPLATLVEVGDGDGNGAITIAELVTAVRRALEGCPS